MSPNRSIPYGLPRKPHCHPYFRCPRMLQLVLWKLSTWQCDFALVFGGSRGRAIYMWTGAPEDREVNLTLILRWYSPSHRWGGGGLWNPRRTAVVGLAWGSGEYGGLVEGERLDQCCGWWRERRKIRVLVRHVGDREFYICAKWALRGQRHSPMWMLCETCTHVNVTLGKTTVVSVQGVFCIGIKISRMKNEQF